MRAHRRVSGPLRTAAASPTRSVTLPALPRLPRLPSLRPLPKFAADLGGRALEVGRGLPDANFLDRLIRSRSWIGLLGFLLIGVVALNVALLKLSATAGREASTASELRMKNAELRGQVARLSTTERIQSEGRRMGLVMPAAADVNYLTARPGDDRAAAHRDRLQPLWSDADIVSAPGPDDSLVPTPPPSLQPVAPAPVTPAAGTTGAAGATGATGTAATGTTPATGTAQTQSTVVQPQTGSTQAATGTTGLTGTGTATPGG